MSVSTATARGSGRQARPPLRLEYASFESRLVAATLDVFVVLTIAALLVMVGSLVVLISSDFERVDPSTTSINVFWICVGAIAPAVLLYLFVSYAWKGQTVGHAVMQLMIIRSDGRSLGVLGSLARVVGLLAYVVFAVAGTIAAVILRDSEVATAAAVGVALLLVLGGLLLAVFDSRRRTLHDRIAGTIVVRIR